MATKQQSADRPHKLKKPKQLDQLTADQTVAVILRLAMEISVLRDRVKTQEQLLIHNNVIGADDIDAYEPDAEDNAARGAARSDLIERIISDLSS